MHNCALSSGSSQLAEKATVPGNCRIRADRLLLTAEICQLQAANCKL
jgi:hypothetical protein